MKSNIITNTGNRIVDSITKMNITGNIIPDAWHNTIVNKTGKSNTHAILILSEVVYWYRAAEVRDEATNSTVYKKKFHDKDFVQLSYDKLGKKYNLSTKQIREALKLLESLGVIKRHLRDVQTGMGRLHNVLFIELFPEVLAKVTYPDGASDEPSDSANTAFPIKKDILPKKEICPSSMDNTNTETTSETTTEITTTAPADEKSLSEAVELFNGLNLNNNDIASILCAAQYDIARCQQALSLFNQQTNSVRNVVGWLIMAVREDYRPVYKALAIKKNSFNDIIHQNYDFDQIEAMILSTP